LNLELLVRLIRRQLRSIIAASSASLIYLELIDVAIGTFKMMERQHPEDSAISKYACIRRGIPVTKAQPKTGSRKGREGRKGKTDIFKCN
jgi:hypothetical protein